MAENKLSTSKKPVVLIGVVAAVAAAGLAAFALSGKVGSGSAASVQVVVAIKDIPAGTAVTAAQLGTHPYAAESVPAGAQGDPAAFVGRYAVQALYTGQPVLAQELAPSAAQAAAAGTTASGGFDPGKGMVAVALPIGGGTGQASADLVGVDGMISPGARVDVLVDSGQGTVRYAFQDLQVVKIGGDVLGQTAPAGPGAASTPPPAPATTSSVMVVVAPRAAAELLTYLASKKVGPTGQELVTGVPRIMAYVLRSSQDKGYLDAGPSGVTPHQDQPVGQEVFTSLFPGR